MSEVREMTVKEMLGLLEWHEQMGRGDFVVKADPRGLCFLKLEHVNVNIVAPPDGEEAVLRFNNVDWWNADIKVRTVLIYDADTRDAINITHLERTAGVYGGFFEYKMPDEGVFRLG